MTATMRIGEVARAAGTTVRTIRYYEEIGLLTAAGDRVSGSHRLYTETDVDRVKELLRLKDLLGVSLDELRELIAAEEARTLLREEFRSDRTSSRRRAAILREALANVQRQQALVERRRAQLDELDAELQERNALILTRLDELGVTPVR
ncbi:MAG: MerR family transcriptional regulator [Solirubrobacterales bacterium]|nr:MerR family transcriptional regulator [Solirubrobacterales bacterium]